MAKQDKPWTARQIRKFLKRPVESLSLQELQDAYEALWQLIQESPANPLVGMWLAEQSKLKQQITIKEAKHGNDQPGNVSGTGSEIRPRAISSEGIATEFGSDTEFDTRAALHGL